MKKMNFIKNVLKISEEKNDFEKAKLEFSFYGQIEPENPVQSPLFDNPVVYLFFLSVVSMQLIEFFLWRNLNNSLMNESLSKLASFLFILQPLFLILIIPTLSTLYMMLFIYSIVADLSFSSSFLS